MRRASRASSPTSFLLINSLPRFHLHLVVFFTILLSLLCSVSLAEPGSSGPNSIAFGDGFGTGLVDADNGFGGYMNSGYLYAGSKRAVDNLQTFTGALGGIQAPKITMSNLQSRPYQVDRDTFADFQSAGARTCQKQLNLCQIAVNREFADRAQEPAVLTGIDVRAAFNNTDCQKQKTNCDTAQRNAPFQTFTLDNLGPDPLDADFDLYCAP